MRTFLSWLLNLGPDAYGPETELSVRWNQSPEAWQVFLLCAGVVAFVLWIYRKDGRGTASVPLRAFLGVLRGLAITTLILILAEPALLATNVDTRRYAVVVLADDSFSMDLAFADTEEKLRKQLQAAMGKSTLNLKLPGGKIEKVDASKLEARHFKLLSRLDVVSAALRNPGPGGRTFLEALRDKNDVKFFGFSKRLSAVNDDEKPLDPANLSSSNQRGSETRIGDSLRQALKELRGQPVAGVVVITDGRQNAGEDAVQAAQTFKMQHIPVFTVAIGDPAEPKDFEVSFEGPEMVLPDDQSEGTAFIRCRGYTGISTIRVEMKNGDKLVAGEDVKLGKPGERTPVPLRFKESKAGKYTYTLRIPEVQGELRTDNNTAAYSFEVVDKKVKVLFVEGQDLPRWEYRYLKNAMRRDHTTECDVLLATSEGTFLWDGTDGKTPLTEFPNSKKGINEYDVIIFGDVSPAIFTSDQVNLVRDFVREGGGFIMIAGERYAPAEYTQGVWAEMLPIVPQRAGFQIPEAGLQDTFAMELTPEGRKLAWTHLDPDENANRALWESLPRLYWYYPVKRKKELATAITVHPFDKDESGGKMPIIAAMPYGSGRTLFIGVDSLWRWRRGTGDRHHYRFYNQAIRYLSMAKRLGGQKRYYLGSDRSTVAIGDRVILSAMLKDENYKEIVTEKTLAHGRNPKGEPLTVELGRMRDRPGSYEGNYIPALQGEYAFWLKDDAQPEAHQSEISFKVEKPQLEFENPRLDEELLQSIAKAGGDGGACFSIDRLQEIPPRIQPKEERIPRETEIFLWDNWLVFALFTLCITCEWLLRKRGRMI